MKKRPAQPGLEFDSEDKFLNQLDAESYKQGKLLDNPELDDSMNEEDWREFKRLVTEERLTPAEARKKVLENKNKNYKKTA